jgi:hypothetical protein
MAEGLNGAPPDEEQIPDDDDVFRAVARAHVQDGEPTPIAFRLEPDPRDGLALSADWSRHSTADQCLARRSHDAAGVATFRVERVRSIAPLTVSHRPLPTNRAHSHVHAPAACDRALRAELRNRLHEIARWAPRRTAER